MQSLVRSGLSVRIGLELSEKPQSLISLTRAIPGSASGSIHRNLKNLRKKELVEEDDGTYRLTNAGTILMRRMMFLIRAFHESPDADGSAHYLAQHYLEYETEMKFILLSGHAKTILCALKDRTLSRDELRELTGARSTTLRTRLKLLMENGYLHEDAGGYLLTPWGGNVAREVHLFLMTIALLSRQKKFWNDHNIDVLPDFAIDSLYRLADMEINYDTPATLTKNFQAYIDSIARAHWIAGISDWATPELLEAYTPEVMALKDIQLLFSPEVIEVMSRSPYKERMRLYENYPNLRVWIHETSSGFALTLTDSIVVLKLHSRDGIGFTNARLRGVKSEAAKQWGLEIIEDFKHRSTPFEDFVSRSAGQSPKE